MEFEYIKVPKIINSMSAGDLLDALNDIYNGKGPRKLAAAIWAMVYGEEIKKCGGFDDLLKKSADPNVSRISTYGLNWVMSIKNRIYTLYNQQLQVNAKYLQKIYFGAPGTGKSHKAKEETSGMKVFRTTFHPDYDYASFVGSYKPIINEEGIVRDCHGSRVPYEKDKKIEYKYVAQIFVKAYCEAWKLYLEILKKQPNSAVSSSTPAIPEGEETQDPTTTGNSNASSVTLDMPHVCLLIEEINRGNCAQIFGDLFQLLDRKNGFSEYSILADQDLSKFIKETLGNDFQMYYETIQENSDITDKGTTIPAWKNNSDENEVRLCLPPNLSIVATMNTSDQSLFPMDSAFKRRWEWEYVPIEYKEEFDYSIIVDDTHQYSWLEFLSIINGKIYDYTKSEDKQMGNFFVKVDENREVSVDQFISKVMFYLWNDICKDNPKARKAIFTIKDDGQDSNCIDFTFADLFDNGNKIKYLINYLESLGVENIYSDASVVSLPNQTTSTNKFKYPRYSINGNGQYSRQSVAIEAVKLYINKNNTLTDQDVFDNWKEIMPRKSTWILQKPNNRCEQIDSSGIYVNRKDWCVNDIAKFIEEVNNSSFGINIQVL